MAVFPRLNITTVLSLLIAVNFILRLHLAFVYQVNWDEFLNLSMVYDYARGDLSSALQTIFVHVFRWPPLVSANEVDQIVAARLIIYLLGLGTCGFLYLICRHYLSAQASLFAVLCYSGFSFVLLLGNNFRTDQLASFVLMASLWLVVCRPATLVYAIFAGVLIGFAGVTTIKSIFFMPTVGGLLLLRVASSPRRAEALLCALASGAVAIISFMAFFLVHRLTLNNPSSALDFLERTTSKTLIQWEINPAIYATATNAILENLVFWLAAILGLLACISGLIRVTRQGWSHWACMLCFAAPLGSMFVYSETYAYYYVFMLVPVSVLCGAGVASRSEPIQPWFIGIGCVALSLTAVGTYVSATYRGNEEQRITIEAVHQMFPDPVPYIDCCSMISSFPKRGIFLSYWGRSDYYRAGTPIMRDVMIKSKPGFLLANRRALEVDQLGPTEYGAEHSGLLKDDVDALRSNFIHHWGPVYVPGKQLTISTLNPTAHFEVLIAGEYTLESAGVVLVDGRLVSPGSAILLSTGSHELKIWDTAGEYILRWGKHLFRPADLPPTRPLFNGF